tara:strand:+ start:279 stop:719 length:441 start_codon:yes stop_codon:yes gene_type:complete
MVVETRYDYIYYTVLDIETLLKLLEDTGVAEEYNGANERDRQRIWINSVNKTFKDSKDYTVSNFKVDSVQYCDHIEHWYNRNMQHKECPVFVKYKESQSVKIKGEGIMFHLYEENEEYEEQQDSGHWTPTPDYGNLDGLAGAGGRL